jgi:hypothetical protein
MASVCEPILRALPEWFGIEESNARYIKNIDVMPTLVAFVGDKAVGFLTIKEHNEYTAEILVMGVLPEVQRRGAGQDAEQFRPRRTLCRHAKILFRNGFQAAGGFWNPLGRRIPVPPDG